MIELFNSGAYLIDGKELCTDNVQAIKEYEFKTGKKLLSKEQAKKNTMTYSIMQNHNYSVDNENLKIKFDALAAHDMTYMGVLQTARASGVNKFPIPFVLTSCHNSLCAVGGTINEDDHVFALSAAKKYGGIYVPPHIAVIHQFMREEIAGGGKMILGADSHTRYGALGALSIGEGAGELVKQLLSKTYDIRYPEVIGVYLTGKPERGIGPQDVALAIIGAVFKNDYVKNKVMEFVGPGVENLSVDFRNGIDVMTTESACLSTIWSTDSKVEEYLEMHGRKDDFKKLNPKDVAYYDGMIYVDLSKVKSMIAMPFHPSNTFTIEEVNANLYDILDKVEKDSLKLIDSGNAKLTLNDKIINNKLFINQGSISGCSGGTYENICAVADIIDGHSVGNGDFSLSVYPGSQPINLEIIKNGVAARIMATGALIKTAFCGSCIGVSDIPANNTLSIRHATRNYPNREGSKPGNGQVSAVALMDARSIAATAVNKGFLTAATDLDINYNVPKYYFNKGIYDSRIYYGFNKADMEAEIVTGPSIADWPKMTEMPENLLLSVASVIHDPVTTTDELIPSGDASSYRSNPLKVAEFTLIRKDPEYVGRAKKTQNAEKLRLEGKSPFETDKSLEAAFNKIKEVYNIDLTNTGFGSLIYAVKPGDGSAREYAASCQKVLGGYANICEEYATKRYRSNLINWGMLPFTLKERPNFNTDDFIFIPNVREVLSNKLREVDAYIVSDDKVEKFVLNLHEMTEDEIQVLLSGCLINYNKKGL